MFVGGPNTAAYARPQYARRGGPPGTIQAQIQENIARHGEKAPEGPAQVNMSTCTGSTLQLCAHRQFACRLGCTLCSSTSDGYWELQLT